jgi:mannose/fructose-specific phosphotransferase system component IIA
MSKDLPETFIITHGDLAFALLDAAEKIVGKQEHVNIYSNKEDSLPVLNEKITKRLEEFKSKHILFFIDLMGGSCWNLANMIRKKYNHIIIITGVNLPMLISYFLNCQEMTFIKLVKKVINDGSRGIYSITK